MQLGSTIYKVKTTTGGFFFAPKVPNGIRGVMGEEAMYQLKKFCAKKEVQGHIISSVVEICAYNGSTPRVSFRDKEYRSMVEELRQTGSTESWFRPGQNYVFFFRNVNTSDAGKENMMSLNFRICKVCGNMVEQDVVDGLIPWSEVIKHGGLYSVTFDGRENDYSVFGDELEPLEDCIEVVPGFYREVRA